MGGANDIHRRRNGLTGLGSGGHPAASAVLGNVVFEEGQVVRGLPFMTTALERSPVSDKAWIQALQERAFSLAGEADRRTAVALAQDIAGQGSELIDSPAEPAVYF